MSTEHYETPFNLNHLRCAECHPNAVSRPFHQPIYSNPSLPMTKQNRIRVYLTPPIPNFLETSFERRTESDKLQRIRNIPELVDRLYLVLLPEQKRYAALLSQAEAEYLAEILDEDDFALKVPNPRLPVSLLIDWARNPFSIVNDLQYGDIELESECGRHLLSIEKIPGNDENEPSIRMILHDLLQDEDGERFYESERPDAILEFLDKEFDVDSTLFSTGWAWTRDAWIALLEPFRADVSPIFKVCIDCEWIRFLAVRMLLPDKDVTSK